MTAQAKVENTNLAIWKALEKTDPAHTKQFSRSGGFKGTALKPMWVWQRLTEEFGPFGIGWGCDKPSFELVPANNELLVFCTVCGWHGDKENAVWGIGGDKVVAVTKNGPRADDEAYKKAFTDALLNAFKFVGAGADIHMGRFDDNKYVEQVAQEYAQREAENDPANDPRREPAAREKLEGPHESKTALRKAVVDLIGKVREADSNEAINALLKAAKPTIAQAEHYWPSLIHGHPDIEEDVGLKGAVADRRAKIEAGDEDEGAFKVMIDSLNACETKQQLVSWLAVNGDAVDALDGAEARSFQLAYDFRESIINEMEKVTA